MTVRRSPMTDNARIVREFIETSEPLGCVGIAEANAAMDRLETELSDLKAELERARGEERERIIGIITDPHNQITWRCPEGASVHADPRFIRAALAPEQKG
jgi:hypothetical protein